MLRRESCLEEMGPARSGRAPEQVEEAGAGDVAEEWAVVAVAAVSAREQAPEGGVYVPIVGREHPIRREFHVPK